MTFQHPGTSTNLQHHNTPRVFIVVGTAPQCHVLHLLNRYPCSLLIVADAFTELAKFRLPPGLQERVYFLPLSENETAKWLTTNRGTEEQQRAIDPLSDFSASTGNAALPGVGLLSMRHALDQPPTTRMLDELAPRLRELAGGDLPAIHVEAFCSQAGGTSTLGGPEATQRISTHLAEETDLPVHVKVFVLGGITFEGRGNPRTQLNAGSGMADWIKLVRQPSHPCVTVDVTFGEVSPVGNNELKRSRLQIEQHTALNANAVRTRWIRDLSNRIVSGPIGACAKVRTDHCDALPVGEVLHNLASVYHPQIQELLRSEPSHHLLCDLEPGYDMRPVDVPDKELLLQRALDAPNADAVPEILAVESGIEAIEWSAVLSEGSRHSLEALVREAAVLPKSPTLYKKQLCLLLAIAVLSRRLLGDLNEEVNELSESLEFAEDQLMETWEAIVEPSFLPLKTTKRRHAEFEEAVDDFQRQSLGLLEAVLEKDSLTSLSLLVDDILQISFDRLHVLSQALENCIHSVAKPSKEPLVEAKPFEACFQDLLTSCLDSEIDEHFEQLRECVASVTRTGLTRITGAEDSNPDSIVSAVINGKAALRGPEWGGKKAAVDVRFFVYPSVSSADKQLLEAAHARHQSEAEIAFCCPSAPTLSVTKLDVTYCREVDDLFVPFYRTGLKKALVSDLSPLIVPDADIPSDIGLTL